MPTTSLRNSLRFFYDFFLLYCICQASILYGLQPCFRCPSYSKKSLPQVSIHEQSSASTTVVTPKDGWKPWTFSVVILVPAMLFTALLVITLGLLQWQNARQGALFFASSLDGFSPLETFLYRYLPTVITVLYGMAWSWIDLDVKRLEPWFQLAQTGGAIAEKSLLLHYPVDFLPLVPLKAAKRRSVASLLQTGTVADPSSNSPGNGQLSAHLPS